MSIVNLISFFFIFLPLFFSERTPVRSGQPRRGSFMRQVAADNALRGRCVIVTPLDVLGNFPTQSSVGDCPQGGRPMA